MTGVKHRHPFRPRSLLSWPGVIAPVAVLVAGALVGAWLATRTTASASQYRLVPVTRTTLSQNLSTTGTIEPQTTANLSFSAAGQVTAVDATVGEHVSDGQTLASMNSPSLQQQAAQAQATLDQDQSRLSQDEASGASSAQIAADQATVAADQSQVDSASQALSGVRLVSPVNGVVTAVGYTAGQQLAGGGGGGSDGSSGASDGGSSGSGDSGDSGDSGSGSGSEMITVVSNSDVINASVDASQTSEIKTGDQATITTEGVNAPVTGTVASIGLIASTSSGVATFPVVIDVTGSTSGLYAGASASVSITYKQVTNALVVPTAAVQPGPGGNSVVDVMVHGQQVPRTVTTGIVSSGLTQITSGLTAGQEAVVNIVTINPGSPGGGGGVFIGPGGVKVAPGGGGAVQIQGGG
jgi:multidrug efflux pump subunit AcrA (membrane-fusion protein)